MSFSPLGCLGAAEMSFSPLVCWAGPFGFIGLILQDPFAVLWANFRESLLLALVLGPGLVGSSFGFVLWKRSMFPSPLVFVYELCFLRVMRRIRASISGKNEMISAN
ncbi:hypothetical protein OIU76_028398 [Salix suchowensis]|nr:hypothetical protein OIU76_028398 [Salix suchowensis]